MEERIKKLANKIEDIVNGNAMGCRKIGQQLAHIHPTLQQNFMRLAMGFVSEVVKVDNADGRNQATLNNCKKIWKALDEMEPPLPFL
jgi:hypothetical protein